MSTLSHLCTLRAGIGFPRDEQGGTTGDLPWIKVSDMSIPGNQHYVTTAMNWVTVGAAERLGAVAAPSGSVVFAKIGEGLKAERLRILTRPTVLDNNMMAAVPTEGCFPRYLYYVLQFVGISKWAVGSALPYLTQRRLNDVPVPTFPPAEQRAIAEVLGALDDKIAANDHASRTMWDLREAEFRLATAHGAATSALTSVSSMIARGGPPRYVEDADCPRVLNQKCVRGGDIHLEHARRTSASAVRSGSYLMRHDILVNSTGMGTLGRVAQWMRLETATVDSHLTIVRPDPDRVHPAVLGLGLMGMERDIEGLAEGSTGQTELPRAQLAALEVVLPAWEQQRALGNRWEQMAASSIALSDESVRLAALRDALLPELMSGRMRVKDAVREVEGVL